MNPFEIVPCKRSEACELGLGHFGLCGKIHVLTSAEVDGLLAQWREGRIPDKLHEPREFAS